MAIIRKARTERGSADLFIGGRGGIFGGSGDASAGGPRRGARLPTLANPQAGTIIAPIDNEVDLSSIFETLVTPFILPNLQQNVTNIYQVPVSGVPPAAADAAAQASICPVV